MTILEKLNFDQVQFVERCSLAAHGEIIQTTFRDQVIIGMRTFFNSPTGGSEALLFTGADASGLLISLDDIGNAPALVVTKFVTVVATQLAPFNPLTRPPEIGNLLQQPGGAIFVRSEVTHAGGVKQPAYICLRGGKDSAGKPITVGEYFQSLSLVNVRGISRSFDVELIPEPLVVVGR